MPVEINFEVKSKLFLEFTTSTTWPETSMQAMGRKKKQKKNKTTPQPIDTDFEDPNILRLFGDEKSPRGTHRCGNVHIPPITVNSILR